MEYTKTFYGFQILFIEPSLYTSNNTLLVGDTDKLLKYPVVAAGVHHAPQANPMFQYYHMQ